MRTARETKTLNSFLANRGFSTLDEPAALLQQLAFCVEDHTHFRQILAGCPPDERRNCYESMRPHLSFEAKPLDVYISEAGQSAEARQLPIQMEDGKLRAFNPPDIRTEPTDEAQLIEDLVTEHLAKVHLVLTCKKCTREEIFPAGRRVDAIQNARHAGWAYDPVYKYEVCPNCLN